MNWYPGVSEKISVKKYLNGYKQGLKLVDETKEEIKFVLKEFQTEWRWIWLIRQNELVELLEWIDNWNLKDRFGLSLQLMENWLLDPLYVYCISRFMDYEDWLRDRELSNELKNNLKLLDKYSENVKIKILQILNI